jgi:hypothetical protein
MDDALVPPIVLLDTGGRPPSGPPQGSEPLTFESVGTLLNYIEAIDVRDGNLDAFDAQGRQIELTADSDKGPINWAIRQERFPAELEELLAATIRRLGPMRLGLIDADLRLDGLLRALWRLDHRSEPYPRDIHAR